MIENWPRHPRIPPAGPWPRTLALLFVLALLLSGWDESLAKPKTKRAPRPEPDLKIVQVRVSPTFYSPSDGELQFVVLVQLPKELNDATILEVSSLVTSPSKTSLRFLAQRQPVNLSTLNAASSRTVPNGDAPRVSVTLTWDGKDHNKQDASPGLYNFEVRAKLLASNEKGARTQMVAWPKRGVVEVK